MNYDDKKSQTEVNGARCQQQQRRVILCSVEQQMVKILVVISSVQGLIRETFIFFYAVLLKLYIKDSQ